MTKNSADLLRVRLRALRTAIPVADRQQNSAALCTLLMHWWEARRLTRGAQSHKATDIIAGFWPLGSEPDLRPVYAQLYTLGVSLVLPKIVRENAPLEFHAWHPDDVLVCGAFNVLEPVQRSAQQPTIVLVPTLGFTTCGERLGYGGGYYDRTLGQMKQTGQSFVTIGIAWDQALISESHGHQSAQHDFKPDAILTPSGWHQHRTP